MTRLCLLAVLLLAAVAAHGEELVYDAIVTIASQHWKQSPRNPYRMRHINSGAGLHAIAADRTGPYYDILLPLVRADLHCV